LNPAGKQVLTITGSNFPSSTKDGSKIKVTLSDETQSTTKTPCDVLKSSHNEIKCLTKYQGFLPS
jgi:hypothetical protein